MKFKLPKKIFIRQNVENPKALLRRKTLQIGLNETDCAYMAKGCYIILDYGVETRGGIRIFTFLAENARARIRFGESVSECCADIGEKNATNDHSPRDFETILPAYSDLTFGETGFRFVRIDMLEGWAKIKNVYAASEILVKKQVYGYSGDDKEVEKIFKVAKRTVDLCAYGNKVWDGVKRDRLIWIGDMHPESMALVALYGRIKCVEHSLDIVKQEYPLPLWMNHHPSYSMWWVIILADYYQNTGCRDYLEKQGEYLLGLVDLMNEHVDEDGNMHYPAYFADWPTYQTDASYGGVRAINIAAAKKAAMLLAELGMDPSSAERLLLKLMKKEIMTCGKKQIIGLKHYATGVLTEEEKATLVDGGARGMSTFMSYYILSAIASFDKKRAVEIMKEYYGGMLQRGATTFWEDFDVDWLEGSGRIDELPKKDQMDIHGDYGAFCYKGFRHSLCHGWSSGVIPFIRENL